MANILKIGFFPGSFRPPTIGHFEVAKIASAQNDYVYIIGSESKNADIQRGFSSSVAKQIWSIYSKLFRNVKYYSGLVPVANVYEVINILNNGTYINPNNKQPRKESVQLANEIKSFGDSFVITVYSGKEDKERYINFNKFPKLYSGKNVKSVNVKTTERIGGYKASDLRVALKNNDVNTIKKFIPKELPTNLVDKVINLMMGALIREQKFDKLWWGALLERTVNDYTIEDLLLTEIYHMPVANLKTRGKNPVIDLSLEMNPKAHRYFRDVKDAELLFTFKDSNTAIKIKKIGDVINGKVELDLVNKDFAKHMKPEQVIDMKDAYYDQWLNKFYSSNAWIHQLLRPMNELLLEGGAGGHIKHPYEVVSTGKELIKLFDDIVKYIKASSPSVKIDGVNASVRFVNNQFVLDRGSAKELDIKGITANDLQKRFPVGHGFLKIGKEVLDILNTNVEYLKPELNKLGMIKDPNLIINLEYVSGTTNVKQYGKNFLALHNILRIDYKDETRRSRKTSFVNYDKSAFNELIVKLNNIASKKNFQVFGNIYATLKSNPNFSRVLSQTVQIYGIKPRTLKTYLSSITVPKYNETVEFTDGTKNPAIGFKVFSTILNAKDNIYNKIDKNYIKLAISGFIAVYATMVLGEELLKNLDSELGAVDKQEGIVIQGLIDEPIKVTGKFILEKQMSTFK